MTEQELQQYLLSKYPKENEGCEWKEFKNMKNDFNGKEKDDVISYVSALSNMEGGHLVIGVVDQTLEIVGTKLLQKSEMRKNMVMDLIYRGFIYAANYSESHYNPRRSQIKTELRYLFVTTPNR